MTPDFKLALAELCWGVIGGFSLGWQVCSLLVWSKKPPKKSKKRSVK